MRRQGPDTPGLLRSWLHRRSRNGGSQQAVGAVAGPQIQAMPTLLWTRGRHSRRPRCSTARSTTARSGVTWRVARFRVDELPPIARPIHGTLAAISLSYKRCSCARMAIGARRFPSPLAFATRGHRSPRLRKLRNCGLCCCETHVSESRSTCPNAIRWPRPC
jgi:hypothetical protein